LKITLPPSAFSYWDEKKGAWSVATGSRGRMDQSGRLDARRACASGLERPVALISLTV
jgi:hypothetical protein